MKMADCMYDSYMTVITFLCLIYCETVRLDIDCPLSSNYIHVCVFNGAVCAVPVGSENHSPDNAVYAPWKSRMPASDRVFHLQARMYANHLFSSSLSV